MRGLLAWSRDEGIDVARSRTPALRAPAPGTLRASPPPGRHGQHQLVDDDAGGGDVFRVVQDQVAVDLDAQGLLAAQGLRDQNG